MPSITRDPLLAAAKAIIYLLIGIVAFAGFFVTLGVPAVIIFSGQVTAQMAADVPQSTAWLVALLLACVAGLLYLAFRFFRHLLQIVNSVGEGDPFVPANADRLTAMAWLMLAINVLALPVMALGMHIARIAEDQPDSIKMGVDFGGIILILTLFILARVFRKGTEMREELEGTV